MDEILLIIAGLVLTLLIIGFIIRVIWKAIFRHRNKNSSESPWYMKVALSGGELASTLFFIVSWAFLWITIYSFNLTHDRFLPTTLIMFFMSLIAIAGGYKLKSAYLLVLGYLVSIGTWIWWIYNIAQHNPTNSIRPAYSFIGAVLLWLSLHPLSVIHSKFENLKRVTIAFKVLSLTGVAVLFSVLSTQIYTELVRSLQVPHDHPIPASMLIALGISFISFVGLTITGTILEPKQWYKTAAIFIITCIISIWALIVVPATKISATDYYYSHDSYLNVTSPVTHVFTLLSLVYFFGIIIIGYKENERWLVNLGTGFIFIFLFVKYFDWFTFLDKSVLFIGAGVLLFIMSYILKRVRSKFLQPQ